MFLGQYEHTIDEKGRLAIPVRFRADLADGLYLTKGVDQCLEILAPPIWQAKADEIMGSPWPKPDTRQLQRNLFPNAVYLVPDRMGRVVIPQHLRAQAGLGEAVLVAGVGDRIEIWDPTAWTQEQLRFVESSHEGASGAPDQQRGSASAT